MLRRSLHEMPEPEWSNLQSPGFKQVVYGKVPPICTDYVRALGYAEGIDSCLPSVTEAVVKGIEDGSFPQEMLFTRTAIITHWPAQHEINSEVKGAIHRSIDEHPDHQTNVLATNAMQGYQAGNWWFVGTEDVRGVEDAIRRSYEGDYPRAWEFAQDDDTVLHTNTNQGPYAFKNSWTMKHLFGHRTEAISDGLAQMDARIVHVRSMDRRYMVGQMPPESNKNMHIGMVTVAYADGALRIDLDTPLHAAGVPSFVRNPGEYRTHRSLGKAQDLALQ